MARNFNKPRKESLRAKIEADNSTIERATPNQLRAWLTQPPGNELLRRWRAWPLKRALELERKDLFAGWMEQGCLPTGQISENSYLVNRVGVRTGMLLSWVAELSPQRFVDLVKQIGNRDGRGQLGELDWGKVIQRLGERDIRTLATMGALGIIDGVPVERLLSHCGGKIVEGWDLDTIISRHQPMFEFNSQVGGQTDAMMAQKLNGVEIGALQDMPVGDLANAGALMTASVAEEHVQMGLSETELLSRSYKRTRCYSFKRMFDNWNRARGTDEEIERAVDNVAPYIDWKKKDRAGNYALNTLNLDRWPQQPLIKLINHILEACPTLIEAKGKDGQPSYLSKENSKTVNIYLDAYRKKNKLTQRLKHNVRQTQALREALREPTEEKPKEVRRPKM